MSCEKCSKCGTEFDAVTDEIGSYICPNCKPETTKIDQAISSLEAETYTGIWKPFPEQIVEFRNGAGRGIAKFPKDKFMRKLFHGQTKIQVKAHVFNKQMHITKVKVGEKWTTVI